MKTVNPAVRTETAHPGARQRRRLERRRTLREEVLAVAVLVVFFVVTVVLLGLQWLGTSSPASPLGAPSAAVQHWRQT